MRSITSVHCLKLLLLAAANKRVANILCQRSWHLTGAVVEANLVEDAEKALFAELAKNHSLRLSRYSLPKTTLLRYLLWLPCVRQSMRSLMV